jgi:hypothetical protein
LGCKIGGFPSWNRDFLKRRRGSGAAPIALIEPLERNQSEGVLTKSLEVGGPASGIELLWFRYRAALQLLWREITAAPVAFSFPGSLERAFIAGLKVRAAWHGWDAGE